MILQTKDNAGVYFVPAFGGLYSPFWNESSTGYYYLHVILFHILFIIIFYFFIIVFINILFF